MFIAGSLGVVWPWKAEKYVYDNLGNIVVDANGRDIITGYTRYFPESFGTETILAIVFMVVGVFIVLSLDWYDNYKNQQNV